MLTLFKDISRSTAVSGWFRADEIRSIFPLGIVTRFLCCQMIGQLFVATVRGVKWNQLDEGGKSTTCRFTDLRILEGKICLKLMRSLTGLKNFQTYVVSWKRPSYWKQNEMYLLSRVYKTPKFCFKNSGYLIH